MHGCMCGWMGAWMERWMDDCTQVGLRTAWIVRVAPSRGRFLACVSLALFAHLYLRSWGVDANKQKMTRIEHRSVAFVSSWLAMFAFLVSPGPLISRLAESALPCRRKVRGEKVSGKRQPIFGDREKKEAHAGTRTKCAPSITCTRNWRICWPPFWKTPSTMMLKSRNCAMS